MDSLRHHVGVYVDDRSQVPVGMPEEPQRFRMIAQIAAWWNIVINAALAIAFLGPLNRGLSRFRHGLLLVYCVVTYAVATVAGFGWLLIAMGVSQTRAIDRRLHMAYIAVFAAILLYREIPWSEAIVIPLLEVIG